MENNQIIFGWGEVATEAVLAVTAIITLALAAFAPIQARKWISGFAFLGFFTALMAQFFYTPDAEVETVFSYFLVREKSFGAFAIGCAMLSGLMGVSYFSKGGKNRNEFLAVLAVCAMGLILFVRSENLMFAFVALECATLCLYVMAGWSNSKASSLEASVKYLVISGVSGAIFLLGVVFIYGAGLSSGVDLLFLDNFNAGLLDPVFIIGVVLVLAGLFFKVAAFPFQFWSPDVYQGAPTPVSAFFAVASKAAGVVFLIRICESLNFDAMGVPDIGDKAVFVVSIIAACTIIIGNFGAITQVNVKRLIGFSSIANSGYILVLVAALLSSSSSMADNVNVTLYFYLVAYMLSTYAVFFVVNQFEGTDESGQMVSDYRGLSRKSATMTGTLTVGLASLAGIPPTAGFFGKVLILISAWYAQLYWLMGVMVLGSVASIYYYFVWMRASYEQAEGSEREIQPSPVVIPTMLALSVLTLIIGLMLLF